MWRNSKSSVRLRMTREEGKNNPPPLKVSAYVIWKVNPKQLYRPLNLLSLPASSRYPFIHIIGYTAIEFNLPDIFPWLTSKTMPQPSRVLWWKFIIPTFNGNCISIDLQTARDHSLKSSFHLFHFDQQSPVYLCVCVWVCVCWEEKET